MSSHRVIRTYLLIAFLYTLAASLIWGVNTLFLLDAGLSVFEVFVANAAFTAGMVLFEIPTGVVADTAGRRASFLWSLAVLLAGTLAYVGLASLGAGVIAFSVVSVFLGLGFTFYTGAVEAWVVDALAQTGYTDPLDRVFTRGGILTGAAMLIGTVGGGLLGTVDLAIPYLVRAALLGLVLIIASFAMQDIGFTPRKVEPGGYPAEFRRVAATGFASGWGDRSIRLILTVTMLQMGVFTWVFYAWPPYLLDLLGSDAVWVAGVVAGGVALSMMLGNVIADALTRLIGRRTVDPAGRGCRAGSGDRPHRSRRVVLGCGPGAARGNRSDGGAGPGQTGLPQSADSFRRARHGAFHRLAERQCRGGGEPDRPGTDCRRGVVQRRLRCCRAGVGVGGDSAGHAAAPGR